MSYKRKFAVYDKVTTAGTLIGSAGMNAFAFAPQATNVYVMVASIVLSVAIPAPIYSATRVAAELWIDCHARG
jgi:hypothetical protein